MATPRRKLRNDFLVFMAQREAMPKESFVTKWLRDNDLGIKTGALGPLFTGKHAPSEIAVKLVKYFLSRGEDDSDNLHYRAFIEYIKSRGTGIDSSIHSIANSILEDDNEDGLKTGIQAFLKTVFDQISIRRTVQRCKPDDIAPISRWINVVSGRGYAFDATVEDAVALSEEKVGISEAELTHNMRSWLAFDPWTVIHARSKHQKVGASVVLPLKQEAYQKVRSGQVHPCGVHRRDLQRPSNYLVIAACCECPVDCCGPRWNVTTCLNIALMRQIAVLSHSSDVKLQEPLHVLSFGATELSETRLKTTGFKKQRATVLDTGLPLYEFVLPFFPTVTNLFSTRAFLRHMGSEADLHPPT